MARYYEISYDTDARRLVHAVKQDKRRQAGELDGSYLLRTDREDLSADEAWRTYMLLTQAEDAFRDMKSPLALRPVFHQAESRVDTHIFLCVLAYHLLATIEKTLLDQGVRTSWATLRDELATRQVCTIVLPTTSGAVLRIRKGSAPEPRHKQIYKWLNMPDKIINPIKTWSEPTTIP